MGKKSYRDGKHYRERAEECRVIAEILATGELRAKRLNVAAEYEQMADLADKLTDEASGDSEVPACDDIVELVRDHGLADRA